MATKQEVLDEIAANLPDNILELISPEDLRDVLELMLEYPALVSLADAQAGTSTDIFAWTPQRVAQAIAALAGDGGGLEMESVQTAVFTPENGKMYPLDVSSTTVAVAVLPPSSPTAGFKFGITDASRSFGVRTAGFVAFGSLGQKFCGQNVNVGLEVPDQSAVFEYIDSTTGWVLAAGSVDKVSDGFLPYETIIRTADFQTERNIMHRVDTSAGIVTAIIQNYSGSGDYIDEEKIGFTDHKGTWGTNSLIIDFGDWQFETVMGATIEMNESSDSVIFQYISGTGWHLVSGDIDPDSSTGGSGDDPDAIHDNEAGEINAITSKATPVSADVILIEDSEDSFNKKKITFSDLQGPAGADGADGADGATGPAGADGADGADGATGPAGADGADGAEGPQGPSGTDGYKFLITSNAHRDSALTNGRISLLDSTVGHQDQTMANDVAITIPPSLGDSQPMNNSRKWGAMIIPAICDSIDIDFMIRTTSAVVTTGDVKVLIYHAPNSAFSIGTANMDMEIIDIQDLVAVVAEGSQYLSYSIPGSITAAGSFGRGDLLFLTLLNNTGATAEFKWNYTIMGIKN